MPTIFYTVTHIFSSPKHLRSIRDELEVRAYVTALTRTFKLLAMREKILLHVSFRKFLQHHALGPSVRSVRKTMLLDDQYLFKMGSAAQTPMPALHKPPAA